MTSSRHVRRADNGYRDYSRGAPERLALIGRARHSGMSVAEVRVLAAAFLRDKIAELTGRIRALQETRRALVAKVADLEARPGP